MEHNLIVNILEAVKACATVFIYDKAVNRVCQCTLAFFFFLASLDNILSIYDLS